MDTGLHLSCSVGGICRDRSRGGVSEEETVARGSA